MFFSIIIPCFNSNKTIQKCLESIQLQTFSDFECIIIDDGSTDNTSEIINKFLISDSRFKYFYQNNQGTSVATNVAIKKCKGNFVVPIDHDDWVDVNYLQELFDVIKNDNGIDVVGVNSFYLSKKGHNKIDSNGEIMISKDDNEKYIIAFDLSRMSITHTATCIRRILLNKVNFIGNGYGADTIVMRVLLHLSNKIALICKDLYNRLENDTSVSRRKQKKDINFDMIIRLEEYLPFWFNNEGPELRDFYEKYLDSRSYFFRGGFIYFFKMIRSGRIIWKNRYLFFYNQTILKRDKIILLLPFLPIKRKTLT